MTDRAERITRWGLLVTILAASLLLAACGRTSGPFQLTVAESNPAPGGRNDILVFQDTGAVIVFEANWPRWDGTLPPDLADPLTKAVRGVRWGSLRPEYAGQGEGSSFDVQLSSGDRAWRTKIAPGAKVPARLQAVLDAAQAAIAKLRADMATPAPGGTLTVNNDRVELDRGNGVRQIVAAKVDLPLEFSPAPGAGPFGVSDKFVKAALAPDGVKVAVATGQVVHGFLATTEVGRTGLTGLDLYFEGDVTDLAWSPDSALLLAEVFTPGGFSRIYVYESNQKRDLERLRVFQNERLDWDFGEWTTPTRFSFRVKSTAGLAPTGVENLLGEYLYDVQTDTLVRIGAGS